MATLDEDGQITWTDPVTGQEVDADDLTDPDTGDPFPDPDRPAFDAPIPDQPDWMEGQPIDPITPAVSGSPSPTFTATGLPPGVTIDEMTGTISGTPTGPSPNPDGSITVTATSPTGTASDTFLAPVAPAPPTFTTPIPDQSDWEQGVPISPVTPTVGGSGPITYSADGLPPGIAIDPATGEIAGTPTGPSPNPGDEITVTATGPGGTATDTFAAPVAPGPPPTFDSSIPDQPDWMVGQPITPITPDVSSNTPVTYTATGLPPGVTIDPTTGTIAGTPTGPSTGPVTVTATNPGGSTTDTFDAATAEGPSAPAFASSIADQPDWVVGEPITPIVPEVTGNPPPTFTAAPLPPGVMIDENTGTISGTPTAAFGPQPITIVATNPQGSDTTTFEATVSPAPAPPVFDTPIPDQPDWVQGQPITPISPDVSGPGPITYTATGLPPGVTIDENTGTISGTPTASGPFSPAVTATGPGGTAADTFDAPVAAAPTAPTFDQPIPDQPDWVQGQPIDPITPQVSGDGPITFTADGLPPGVTIDETTGTISGTPTGTGAFTPTVTATGPGGTTTDTFDADVAPAPTPPVFDNPIPDQTFTEGQPIDPIVPDVSGTGPITFTAAGLPDGLTIDENTGTITGTPTTPGGPTPVTVTATGPGGSTTDTFNATVGPDVSPQPVAFTPPDDIDVPIGEPIPPLSPTDVTGDEPITWTTTKLPPGLTVDPDTGTISGTPTGPPQVCFLSLCGTNSEGQTCETFTITVVPAPVIDFVFLDAFDAADQACIEQGRDFLDSIFTEPLSPEFIPGDNAYTGVRIELSINPALAGTNTIAQARPLTVRADGRQVLTGEMSWNPSFLAGGAQGGDCAGLTSTAIHEGAHALGSGFAEVLAPESIVLGDCGPDGEPGGGDDVSAAQYVGAAALAAYRATPGNAAAAFVPMEDCDGGHWSEADLGVETMTPATFGGATPFSAISIGQFTDIGYPGIDDSVADPYP